MDAITIALLKDLQNDLDNIKKSNDKTEVLGKLQELKNSIDTTIKLILKV